MNKHRTTPRATRAYHAISTLNPTCILHSTTIAHIDTIDAVIVIVHFERCNDAVAVMLSDSVL